MEKTIRHIKYEVMAFDLENTVDDESIKNKETRMWIGCLIGENANIDDDNNYFSSMDEFLDRLQDLTARKRVGKSRSSSSKNLLIYIWNLSFEWSFIFPALIARGFHYGTVKSKRIKDSGLCVESVTNRSCSSVWTAKLKFNDDGGIIVFKDLAKLLGGSLKSAAQSLKTKTQKGDDDGELIDYRKPRLEGYKPTIEEKHYNFNDCEIVMEILAKINESDDPYFWKNVSAASWSANTIIAEAYKKYKKPMKQYRSEYPTLYAKENEFIRKTIRGGICYATPYHRMEYINTPVFHIDAHQMHPSQMYNKFFPYGHGKYFVGKPQGGYINAVHVLVSYCGVKIHSNIDLLNHAGDFADNYELYIWDFEIPTMYKCYENLEITYIDGYQYKMRRLPWRNLLEDNYKKRKICKKNGDDYGQKRYKLLNNSFYGKLLENSHNDNIINIINEQGLIDTHIAPKEGDNLSNCGKYAYIPVGSCIPAYSRCCLVEMALKFDYRDVVYFDTDSVFVCNADKARKVWDKLPASYKVDMFGGWGLEGENGLHYKMFAVCAKRYMTEDSKGNKDIKCAGMRPFDMLEKAAIKAGYLDIHASSKKQAEQMNAYIKHVDFNDIKLDNIEIETMQRIKAKGGTLLVKKTKLIRKEENNYARTEEEDELYPCE